MKTQRTIGIALGLWISYALLAVWAHMFMGHPIMNFEPSQQEQR